jgi:hypothetical protein
MGSHLIRDQFDKRVENAKDVEVVEYEIIAVDYDEISKKATVNAKITYSTRSSNRVRTLIDKQVWSYEDQKGSKQWRLMTLLPEFKSLHLFLSPPGHVQKTIA